MEAIFDLDQAEPIHLWAGRIWAMMLETGEMSQAELPQRSGRAMVDELFLVPQSS